MKRAMTPLVGILQKELKIAFTTPIAYVVYFFFTLLTSLQFYKLLLNYEKLLQRARHFEDEELLALLNFNDAILADVFGTAQPVFVFLIPILTMRALAEEKRHKTMELLMTTPISPWHVVLGKYLAFLTVLLGLCVIVLVYPSVLALFGSNSLVGASVVDWPTTLLGVLGVFLSGAMFGAIGLAFSSITENQIVAALVTFFALFLLWGIAQLGDDVPGWLGDVLVYLSPRPHILGFANGILRLADVVYYLSFAGFFLFFTHRMVEGQRWR